MDENARKRKRDEDEVSEIEGVVSEVSMHEAKRAGKLVKKQKRETKVGETTKTERPRQGDANGVKGTEADIEVTKTIRAAARREKKRLRKEKEEAKAAKREAKKQQKEQEASMKIDVMANGVNDLDEDPRTEDMNQIDAENILDKSPNGASSASTATPSPAPQSPGFDTSTFQSGSSSISSIAPPINAEISKSDKPLAEIRSPKPDPEELKTRLQQRIEFLRAARKADGLNGNPARNRQELMEARRRKEEERKAHKKELRQKARDEELQKQKELLARGSPLLLGSSSGSTKTRQTLPPRPSSPACSFSFGRIAFTNGQKASAELSTVLPAPRQKGPQDPLTALQAVQNKQTRLSALDAAKRDDIAEKDLWLNAKKRAQGERVRDDAGLLKRTLKRKELTKRKSEREWGERVEGVEKGKAVRAKRREDNIRKRREEKGRKKSGGGDSQKKKKRKGRPGFEGSFRAKAVAGGKGK